jgi:hypothetical protein
VIAFKFLARGAVGPFSAFQWPTPARGAPGAWVDAAGELPARGVHACRPADLPYWIHEELWVAELDGDVLATPHQVVASRGRLLERVEGWPVVARAFAEECAAALRAGVEEAVAGGALAPGIAEQLRAYAADAEACVRLGSTAPAAYVAARAAAALHGSEAAVAVERRRQAAWLEQRLAIASAWR